MKTVFTLCLLLFLFLSTWIGCDFGRETTRARDPWVFRINLDDRARSIVLALHDDMWVAYDPPHGGMYKVWKGGVHFRGPVYDLIHRVQPLSIGEAYMVDSLKQSPWRLRKGDKETAVIPEYVGYELGANSVTLRFEIALQNTKILLEEKPEFVIKDKRPGLERIFFTHNIPAGTDLVLAANFTHLSAENDIQTDGKFTATDKSTEKFSWGETLSLAGELILNANAKTKLRSYFDPRVVANVAKAVEPQTESLPDKAGEESTESPLENNIELMVKRGKSKIGNNDCAACHTIEQAQIGPSYTMIANKYEKSVQTIENLADKIINGGAGVWGVRAMTAHPTMTETTAKDLAAYILSLQTTEKVPLQPGVIAHFYDISKTLLSLPDVVPGQNPNVSRVFPNVNFRSGNPDLGQQTDEQFAGFRNGFVMHVEGFLDIKKKGKYDFKLLANEGGVLHIDDQMVVIAGRQAEKGPEYGSLNLEPGKHAILIEYFQHIITKHLILQWRSNPNEEFVVVPSETFLHNPNRVKPTSPGLKAIYQNTAPGFGAELTSVHPSYDLTPVRPSGFEPRVGGMDFDEDGNLIICTWDGEVFVLEGVEKGDPKKVKITEVASGLAEPLGIKVVDGEIYVIQRWELTHLVDADGDGITDEYRVVNDDWKTTADFHEWAFGLAFKEGFFYANLGIAQGRFSRNQVSDRGKMIKIALDGSYDFVAHGLRAPNGIGLGIDDGIFTTDNEGTYVPASKLMYVPDNDYTFFGNRDVLKDSLPQLQEMPPVLWLPQNEIGNSPSEPARLYGGPYKGQMVHGDITHGGLKRDFIEKVKGQYQGAVFRFVHGLEAGVNRLTWGPDGSLYIGGLGSAQDFGYQERRFGLERLTYNGKSTFEMLAIRARSNGLEIEFSEPLRIGDGTDPEDYIIQQWWYEISKSYGGGKQDLQNLHVQSVTLSKDRKKVFLQLDGLKRRHVLYLQLQPTFLSANNQQLWSNEAWYTMNEIPDIPGEVKATTLRSRDNHLNPREIKAGWHQLFDGKSSKGWRGFEENKLPTGWKIQGVQITNNGTGEVLLSEASYQNFELEWDWKINRESEAGLYFGINLADAFQEFSLHNPRVQMVDDRNNPRARAQANHLSGANYDLQAPLYKISRALGDWNKSRLVVENGQIEHWLNGLKVVTYQINNQAWKEQIKSSIYAETADYGQNKNGVIGFQCNQGELSLKNIRIRELAL